MFTLLPKGVKKKLKLFLLKFAICHLKRSKWDSQGHGRRNFKDTNPFMSFSLVILFGVVKKFGRLCIWSETKCKIPAEYGLHSTIHPPTLPPSDTYCLYKQYIQFEKGGRRSERRQRGNSTQVQFLRPWGQQFTSWVENTNQ